MADLNKAVIWISKSSSLFTNPSVTATRAPITIGIIVTFMFYIFSIPKQGAGTYPSFRFLSLLLCGQPVLQSPQFDKSSSFFSFVDCY